MDIAMVETRRAPRDRRGVRSPRTDRWAHSETRRLRSFLIAAALALPFLLPQGAPADDTPTPTATAIPTITPTPTPVTDYYVSVDTGNDTTGDGTQAAPWASIAMALDSIGKGGTEQFPVTIRIAGGTYYETDLDFPYLMDYVSLYGGYAPLSWERDIANHPTVLDGSTDTTGSPCITPADHCTLDGLTVQDIDGFAVSCSESSPVITHCRFLRGSTYAIWTGANAVVRGNVFIGNEKGGIISWSKGGSSATVENNLILSSDKSSQMAGIVAWGSVRIINNTIAKNGRGVEINSYDEDPSPTVLIQNNIIAENWIHGEEASYGIYIQDDVDASGVTIRYNDLWNNLHAYGGIAEPGEGDFSADPGCINSGGDDYHLGTGSPCIDAGIADGAPPDDLDGNTRPAGSGPDLGCYEYQDGGPSPAPEGNSLAVLLTADRFRAGETLDVYVQFWDTILDWDGYLVFTGNGGVWSATAGGLVPGIRPIVRNALEMHRFFSARAFSAAVPSGIAGDYTIHAAILPSGTEPSMRSALGSYSQYDAADFSLGE